MFYSEADVQDLLQKGEDVPRKALAIREAYIVKPFGNEKAQEYARHGFGRRIKIVSRCIERIFDLIPPTQDIPPEEENRTDTVIHVHTLMTNLYGCIDNLAWVWCYEKNIVDRRGNPIRRNDVGLRVSNREVRNSFSDEFQTYLATMDRWFEYLVNFRDALSHRIPMYIPPFSIDPRHEEKYNDLESQKLPAILEGNFKRLDALEQQLMQLAHFRPVLVHSFSEDGRQVPFHSQTIADFLTVEEIAKKMLEEFE